MSAPTRSTSQFAEEWLQSYRPHELFDQSGALRAPFRVVAPTGTRRMSANPHANGGLLLQDLELPDFRRYAVTVGSPGIDLGRADAGARELLARRDQGESLDPFVWSVPTRRSRTDCPLCSRPPIAVLEAETLPGDEFLAPQGRVMEILSEHVCEGWLEGYLLTGRHGLFNCYEAFIHIVDSMLNQHAKWLKTSKEIPWETADRLSELPPVEPCVAPDHNGFSHQDPGFIDHLVNEKPAIVRVYLPPDANTLFSVADHCLRSRDYVNLIVAGKQPALTYLTMEEAVDHAHGVSGSSNGRATMRETFRCGSRSRVTSLHSRPSPPHRSSGTRFRPQVRVVNVVDLMRMSHETEHPHGLPEANSTACSHRTGR